MNRNLPEHILQIASELFYQQGIQATGIDAIVKASGVAKMSLYKYFPSKDDLILAYLQQSANTIQQRIVNGVAEKPCPVKQKLLVVFQVFAELLNSPGFRGCPFINASAEFAEQAGPIQQVAAEFYQNFNHYLTSLAMQANIKQAESLAKQLVILITGAMVCEQIQPKSGAMQQAMVAAELLINANDQ